MARKSAFCRRLIAAPLCAVLSCGWLPALPAAFIAAPSPAAAQPQGESFKQWIAGFRPQALAAGITPQTFARAFAGIDSPDPDVLRKAAYQPEFTDPTWNYFDNRVNSDIIAAGRQNAQKWRKWLKRIESRYGVDPDILLGIWSMETGYGEVLKRDDVMRSAVRSLATLAYGDPKRGKYARAQLIAAMKILQSGDIDTSHLRGSWAGALGHTQFIPTSYLAYAVDIDGDGRRDIWNSVPDALASAANLLAKNGWQRGLRWGYEVRLPNNGRKFPAGALPLGEWRQLGVQPALGGSWPAKAPATLKLPDGRGGPAFLVTKNFFVIKRYNNADRYALAVGLLSDAISGRATLKQDWIRPFAATNMAEKREIQQRLKAKGLYDGNIDGKSGTGTREAIRSFEKQSGMAVNGYPSREVLLRLRQSR